MNEDAIVQEMEVEEKPAEVITAEETEPYAQAVDDMYKLFNAAELGSGGEDAKCLYEMFQRMTKDNGEIKFSPYNRMTDSLKAQVRQTAMQYGITSISDVQAFAKTILTQLYQDATIDKAWAKLQEDIKRTNRIPEQMDIFGSVLYDRMVCGALVKSIALKDKDPENFNENNVFVKSANIFLTNWFFIKMMEVTLQNAARIKKSEKNIKRVLDDVDSLFKKANISVEQHTTASAIYASLSKKFSTKEAAHLMTGVCFTLETCTDGSIEGLQTAFVLSLINGVMAYINLDSEVQTEQGKLLLASFDSYVNFCDKILEEDYESANNILSTAREVKDELYSNELVRAEAKYQENIAAQVKTPDCDTAE